MSGNNYLVDNPGPGEVLVITFGFYDGGGDPQYEFAGRLQKLEHLSGRKLAKVLLRDPSNSWYHYGVPPWPSVVATVDGLRTLIGRIAPARTIAIGQSMGGYGAILYGALLGVDQVVAFGPLSCFDSRKLEVLRDYRWMEHVKRVETQPPGEFYNDLPELLRRSGGRTAVDIIYGTNPGSSADRGEAVNFDAAHALQFYGIGNVKLSPIHSSPHAVVEYFRANKVLDALLLHRLFGLEPRPPDTGVGEAWAAWLETNITLGCREDQLVDTLVAHQFSPDAAKTALEIAQATLVLKKACT